MEASKENWYTIENIKNFLEVLKTKKASDELMLAGCRNCGDMFQVTFSKQKCNCGNVSFEAFNEGGEAQAKQEKAMQKIRSWNQKKKNNNGIRIAKKIKAILEKRNVSKYLTKKEHTHKVSDIIKEDAREWELAKTMSFNEAINKYGDCLTEENIKELKQIKDGQGRN